MVLKHRTLFRRRRKKWCGDYFAGGDFLRVGLVSPRFFLGLFRDMNFFLGLFRLRCFFFGCFAAGESVWLVLRKKIKTKKKDVSASSLKLLIFGVFFFIFSPHSKRTVFVDGSRDFRLFFFRHVWSCCSTHSWRELTLRHKVLFFLTEFVSKRLLEDDAGLKKLEKVEKHVPRE